MSNDRWADVLGALNTVTLEVVRDRLIRNGQDVLGETCVKQLQSNAIAALPSQPPLHEPRPVDPQG